MLFTGTINPNTGKSMIYSRSFNPTLNPTYSSISQGWFYSGEYVLTSRLESWIALSVALISIQWMCIRETNFVIHWIEIDLSGG